MVLAGAADQRSSATEVEGRARDAYLDLDFRRAIEGWEEAYAAYRAANDQVNAIRMARTLACMYGTVVGDAAVMSGWLARARTLLAAAGDSAQRGWVALNTGMFEPDRGRKQDLFREAVVGGDVADVCALEEIFCQLFSACEHAHDVRRADEWMRIGAAVAQRRRIVAVSAYCHTHYGGVLTAAGRWPEADAALSEAVALWTLGNRSTLRRGATIRLADLRVRQGRIEEAELLLDGLSVDVEAARPLAAVHLAKGETARASDVLERALVQLEPGSASAAPLMALLVDVHLAQGDSERAAAAAQQLDACAARHPGPYLAAAAALAMGQVRLATGDGEGARTCLRAALAGFAGADLPMELACARLELANAAITEQPEVALAEARAAFGGFERLRAARHVDAAAAVLRALGVRVTTSMAGVGRLTNREAEVLGLVGHGLSNPEIADRLFISRKTVEHHVGNLLAKLGLRNRAEVARYAARTSIPAHE